MAKKQHKEKKLTESEKKLLEKYPDGQIPFDDMMKMAVNTTPASKAKGDKKYTGKKKGK